MSDTPHQGNIQPQLDLEEHNHSATAKRVTLVSATGTTVTPADGHIYNSDGTDNSLSAGGQIFQKVGIVADIDKYIRGNIPVGSPISDPVVTGSKDGSGNVVADTGTATGKNVVVASALPAGSALIGKVGIDQTTDGTTNKVYVGNTPSVNQIAPVMTTVEFGTLSVGTAGTYVIGTIPGSAYELTVCNASDTDMYWSYKTATTASNGIFLAKSGGAVSFIMPASKSPFFYCSATKNLNWTTRTL